MSEVSWKSPTLNKGKSMFRQSGDITMTVDHVDRVIDPYLAGVMHKGRIVYSGLHASLSEARAECEQKAKDLS
ncbi:hypothetical protein [Phyllobacterium myrsinacearum]|uniref:Fe-S cluster assembly ATPase SufC n=1 Tax=Phyllobacterium myrsinacearum TaxID=28101 RepID=A0A839EVU6_9HYPH|nr:hypothetical protein [Phyllobacterium myrsinacearum]MBA8881634.1 Fe-S cluster assembly ATPase SufC [Phyllobacterium myrsinacearum]